MTTIKSLLNWDYVLSFFSVFIHHFLAWIHWIRSSSGLQLTQIFTIALLTVLRNLFHPHTKRMKLMFYNATCIHTMMESSGSDFVSLRHEYQTWLDLLRVKQFDLRRIERKKDRKRK